MTTFHMIDTNAGEVMHLFEVMKRHGVTCSLEFKLEGVADPLIGISEVNADVDYLEGADGDNLIVIMGDAEFSFSLKDHSFSKCITDNQIMITIVEDDGKYTAWFDSGAVSPAGIQEARSYEDAAGDDETFTEDEKELICFIRSLEFDDVLDAVSGIEREADNSKQKAAVHFREGNQRTASAFEVRAAKLSKLAELLGDANTDYVAHIHPDASEDIV